MCLKKTYFLGPEHVPQKRMVLTFDGFCMAKALANPSQFRGY